MPAATPFSITPDALDYICNRIAKMPAGVLPEIILAESQTDGEQPPRWRYDGKSFIMGYYDSDQDREGEPKPESFEIQGYHLAANADVLKELAGRTLALRRVDASRGVMKQARSVLVAVSAGELARLGNNDSAEKKRVASIIALSVLSGFTGMGVFWVVVCPVLMVSNPAGGKFLPYILPLLFTGWVVGAVIGFFFFRSIYQTKGRTRFRQEQIAKKYLGEGGLDMDLSMLVFAGIPIPLTAIALLILEPLTRTDAQKSGVAVAAIVVMFAVSMILCERLPHRWVFRLGLSGWVVSVVIGYLFFKIHGP